MADAWGGSWGSSWGLSWTGSGTPAPPADETDTHDGRPRLWDVRRAERTQQERERLRKASEDELRSIVERAFRRANGEPEPDESEPLAQPGRRELARFIQADIRTDGLSAKLRDIEALILEYERLVEEERDDEEAAAILLLMN